MNAQNLGFMSSWHMLTRDKGWVKPVLVLTLVGWIPILGQIVLMGYGLEWARLTAWGVDAAPKQRGVDYGKVLSTGGRAFLVSLSWGSSSRWCCRWSFRAPCTCSLPVLPRAMP